MTERCGCCEGITKWTPEDTANPPGRDRLSLRVGDHWSFYQTMQACLSAPAFESLAGLKTREGDDPSLALLDAFATMADVLTFYQERIANEGYLATAIERRSVIELGRLVGYRPRPGVAASVYLAFELEAQVQGADLVGVERTPGGYQVVVPAGTRAQSVPEEPGELPQSFETSKPLDARTEWSLLQPRRFRPQFVTPTTGVLHFADALRGIKAGDPMLLEFAGAPSPIRVTSVAIDEDESRTAVTVATAGTVPPVTPPPQESPPEPPAELKAPLGAQLKAIVAKYGGPGTKPSGIIAKRVLAVMRKLSSAADSAAADELSALADDVLAKLNSEIGGAQSTWKVTPWMKKVRDEIAAAQAAAAASTSSGWQPDTPAAQAPSPTEPGTIELLANLVTTLNTPPSVQPATAVNLARPLDQVYAAEADLTPSLLAALNPRAGEQLYKSWSSVATTTTGDFVAAHTFSASAAPFGHNAPLESIANEKGVIVHQREWALTPSEVEMRLLPVHAIGNGGSSGASIRLSATIGGQTVWQVASPPTTLMLGAVKAAVTLDPHLTVSFGTPSAPDQDGVTLVFDQDARTLSVNGDSTTLVDTESPFFTTLAGRSVEVGPHAQYIRVNPAFGLTDQERRELSLDAVYDDVLPGGWVLTERAGTTTAHEVESVQTVSLVRYGLSSRVTKVELDSPWLEKTDLLLSAARETAVYLGSNALDDPSEPATADIAGGEIELGELYAGLEAGRWIIVEGERSDVPGQVRAAELAMISGITQRVDRLTDDSGNIIDRPGDQTHTFLALAAALEIPFRRDTVKIHGNVALATHGETRQEVLGSGKAVEAFQQFSLSFDPLTYVAAPTPSGIDTTLKVAINNIYSREQATLVTSGPNDHVYATAQDDDAKTTITFGDGKHGARLPTGSENVAASYRAGIGIGGNVAARQISLLATTPLGLKGVSNPIRASGGADAEGRDHARRNVPRTVTALDRLVSVQDHEDFVATFAGIAKAQASLLSDGRRQLIHVTIAGLEDAPIDTSSSLHTNLLLSLARFGATGFPVQVAARQTSFLILSAKVRLGEDRIWDVVEPIVRGRLLDAFGFEARRLGQSVFASEVISVIHETPGVAWVDLDVFDEVREGSTITPPTAGPVRSHIAVGNASIRPDGTVNPARITYLTPAVVDTVILQELTP